MTLSSPSVTRGSSRTHPAPARPISRRRRLLFIAAPLALLCVAQEVGFRVAFPMPEVHSFNRSHYSRHQGGSRPYVPGKGVKNLVYRVESEPDGYSFDQTLNLYGFRGPNFAIAPPRDRPRVLFIGDSFVEGMGASDRDTVPLKFAEALGEERPVEALNLGVSGAGFDDYARLVRDGVDLLRPDAVFLVVYANDLPAPPYPAEADRPPPAFPRLNPFMPRAAEVVGWLGRGWAVARFFPSGPIPFFRPVPSPLNPLTTERAPERVDPEILDAMKRGKSNPSLIVWARVVEGYLRHDFSRGGGAAPYLGRIASLCRRAGADLIVVYIPASVAVHRAHVEAQMRIDPESLAGLSAPADEAHRAQQRHLRRVADDLGLPLLDLTDELIHAEATRGRMFWPVDTHCNADGYRLVAEACARAWIEREGRRSEPSGTR